VASSDRYTETRPIHAGRKNLGTSLPIRTRWAPPSQSLVSGACTRWRKFNGHQRERQDESARRPWPIVYAPSTIAPRGAHQESRPKGHSATTLRIGMDCRWEEGSADCGGVVAKDHEVVHLQKISHWKRALPTKSLRCGPRAEHRFISYAGSACDQRTKVKERAKTQPHAVPSHSRVWQMKLSFLGSSVGNGCPNALVRSGAPNIWSRTAPCDKTSVIAASTRIGGLGNAEVPKHHGARPDLRDGIGQSLASQYPVPSRARIKMEGYSFSGLRFAEGRSFCAIGRQPRDTGRERMSPK